MFSTHSNKRLFVRTHILPTSCIIIQCTIMDKRHYLFNIYESIDHLILVKLKMKVEIVKPSMPFKTY